MQQQNPQQEEEQEDNRYIVLEAEEQHNAQGLLDEAEVESMIDPMGYCNFQNPLANIQPIF